MHFVGLIYNNYITRHGAKRVKFVLNLINNGGVAKPDDSTLRI
jgi:hypothetical protein